MDLLSAIGILFLVFIAPPILSYFIPKKLGYPKTGKILSIVVSSLLILLLILTIYQDELLPQNSAEISKIQNYSTQKIDNNTNIFYKANNNITNPKARGLFNKGLTLVKKEDYLNAEILFLQANKIEPNNSEILNSLALSLFSLSKKQNAYKLFEKAIDIDKTFAYSYTNYAYCLNKERKFQKAINYLDRGIKYASNNKRKAVFNYTLAISYFGINECDLSKKNIDLAINIEADKVLLKNYKKFKYHLQSNCN